jgi:hypothetical protein
VERRAARERTGQATLGSKMGDWSPSRCRDRLIPRFRMSGAVSPEPPPYDRAGELRQEHGGPVPAFA